MARDPESRLLIRFEALGIDVDRIEEWSIDSDYLTDSDGWTATVYDERLTSLRSVSMQPVELLLSTPNVAQAQQLVGRVDGTQRGDTGKHGIQLTGRDYLGDLVSAEVDPLVRVTKDMTLDSALRHVGAPYGIQLVLSDGETPLRNIRSGTYAGKKVQPSFKELKPEELKPQTSQKVFDFMNRLAARHGATIQPYTKRDTLILSAPDYAQPAAFELRRTDDPNLSGRTNVIRAVASESYAEFPTFTLLTAKGGGGGKQSKSIAKELDMGVLAAAYGDPLASIIGGAIVGGRRKPTNTAPLTGGKLYRLLHVDDEESSTYDQAEKAGLRALGERLKDTLVYKCSVRGHEDPVSRHIWSVDMIAHVSDSVAGVDEPLWISSRTLRYSQREGAVTDLVLWRRGAMQI